MRLLSEHLVKIVIGVALAVLLLFAIHAIRASGKAEMRADVLEETVKETNNHVKIEEGQNEIQNRDYSDAALYDSLYKHTF